MGFLARIFAATVFVGVLVGLGVTDYALTGNKLMLPAVAPIVEEEDPVVPPPSQGSDSSVEGVAPEDGPGIEDTLAVMQLTASQGREDSVLRDVLPQDWEVSSAVLLKNGDRIAYFAWTEGGQVKTYFSALKEALHGSFSEELRDLIDQTQEREGKPVRNILSFTDPKIFEERMVFVRVRQHLFEFHVAPGKDAEVDQLIDALTE